MGKATDIPVIVIKKCSTLITEHVCGFMNNFIENWYFLRHTEERFYNSYFS